MNDRLTYPLWESDKPLIVKEIEFPIVVTFFKWESLLTAQVWSIFTLPMPRTEFFVNNTRIRLVKNAFFRTTEFQPQSKRPFYQKKTLMSHTVTDLKRSLYIQVYVIWETWRKGIKSQNLRHGSEKNISCIEILAAFNFFFQNVAKELVLGKMFVSLNLVYIVVI